MPVPFLGENWRKTCRLRRDIVVRIRWSKQAALNRLSDCLCILEVYDWIIWRTRNRLDHRRAGNCRFDAPSPPSTPVNVGDAVLLALLRHFGCGGYTCDPVIIKPLVVLPLVVGIVAVVENNV